MSMQFILDTVGTYFSRMNAAASGSRNTALLSRQSSINSGTNHSLSTYWSRCESDTLSGSNRIRDLPVASLHPDRSFS